MREAHCSPGRSAIEEKPNLLLGVKSEVRGSKIRA